MGLPQLARHNEKDPGCVEFNLNSIRDASRSTITFDAHGTPLIKVVSDCIQVEVYLISVTNKKAKNISYLIIINVLCRYQVCHVPI